jgi:uncharacterized membrane protein YccC
MENKNKNENIERENIDTLADALRKAVLYIYRTCVILCIIMSIVMIIKGEMLLLAICAGVGLFLASLARGIETKDYAFLIWWDLTKD